MSVASEEIEELRNADNVGTLARAYVAKLRGG
ncbi:MAG: hypothetical protein JWP31_225, partial [Aeromicrobium sp.]|nr:hypothetical protein [Aeromicrobium sp.]